MKHIYSLAAGFGLGMIVMACATPFPFKYYSIDLKDHKLLGPSSADDLLLSVCDATDADKAPCFAMERPQFLDLKKAYVDCQDALVACQHGGQ